MRHLIVPLFCAFAPFANAATFVVTTSTDAGDGSLRAAIALADSVPGVDTIAFAIPGTGPHRIALQSPLEIRGGLLIDGYTQPGAGANTAQSGSNAQLMIELDGGDLVTRGLWMLTGEDLTIRGLSLTRFTNHGIALQGTGLARIEGNWFGLAPDGVTVKPNRAGLWVYSADAMIGGTSVEHRNLFSGNTLVGMFVEAPRVSVCNNLVGTDPAGNPTLGNGLHGIANFGLFADDVRIGGDWSCPPNVIAGNAMAGIAVYPDSTGVRIENNRIFANGGMGIDLIGPEFAGWNAVNPNDPGDLDSGGNEFQNAPELQYALRFGSTVDTGLRLQGKPATAYRIQLFLGHQCDPRGNSAGDRLVVDMVRATSSDNGDLDLISSFSVPSEDGTWLRATATDPAGNTSEFSNCVQVFDEGIFGDNFGEASIISAHD